MSGPDFTAELSSLEAWSEISGPWCAAEGALSIPSAGRLTLALDPADRLTLSLTAHLTSRSNLRIELGKYLFRLGEGAGQRWTIERDGRLFAESYEPVAGPLGEHGLVVSHDRGELTAAVDGRQVLAASDLLPQRMAAVAVSVAGATGLRGMNLIGRRWQQQRPHRRKVKPEFEYQVTVDYPDDLWLAEGQWDEAILREMVRTYADWGIKRLYWMHYGGRDGGMFERGPYIAFGEERSHQFHQQVPEPLAVVADECHQRELEVYGILKTFEDALGFPYANAADNEDPPPPRALEHVGGRPVVSYRFVREHADLQMTRHPAACTPEQLGPIDEICLYHQDDEDLGLAPGDFRLWVSDYNDRYEPYQGPVQLEERVVEYAPPRFAPAPGRKFGPPRPCRRFRLSGLRLGQRFAVIEINDGARSAGIANSLEALVEVRSAGKAMLFTYGLAPVQRHHEQQHDWRRGIAFDAARQTIVVYGRGLVVPQSAGRFHFTLGPGSWIAIGMGRNRHPMGITDPCHAEVRAWWLSRVEDMIRAGADGVDIRLTTHTENLDWENYGFSAPIVGDFKRRYGVDITRDTFSREAWRRLRGEYYDLFLKQASDLLGAAGKRLQFQLHRWLEFGPDGNTFMETAWNWREWIRGGLVNEVLMRGPDFDDPLFHIVQAETEAAGLPAYVQKPIGPGTAAVLDFIRRCQETGMDGVNLYEGASLLRLRANGELAAVDPSIVEALRAARH